jgi:hypothetical protein
MKKNSQRKPKPKTPQRPAAKATVPGGLCPPEPAHEYGREERKVGIVSGTPADAFDETAERKRDKWVAIYISVLAVLIAIAATGSNDAMKTAQQAGFGVNDNYAFFQARRIRKEQYEIASKQLELKQKETPNLPGPAQDFLKSSKAEYDKEITRLDAHGKDGMKELLAKAESCENERSLALAQHPFYDYSMAMLQIAIVLASASIITGTRILLGGSAIVGIFGILLFLNGYTLFYGTPPFKHDRADALAESLKKAGVQSSPASLRCIEE